MQLTLDILFSFEMIILSFLAFCCEVLSIILVLLLDLPCSCVGGFIHHCYFRLHNQQLYQLQEAFELFLLHPKSGLFCIWHFQVFLITYKQGQTFGFLSR